MTPTTERPLDADPADVYEQHQPVTIDEEPDLPDHLGPLDADPADALDQHRTVLLDEDEWPT